MPPSGEHLHQSNMSPEWGARLRWQGQFCCSMNVMVDPCTHCNPRTWYFDDARNKTNNEEKSSYVYCTDHPTPTMAFHHEWAWYNLYFPNPDGALCRPRMTNQEWNRMTRWRDFDWFNEGGQESNRILTYTKQTQPSLQRTSRKVAPHLLPPAGVISSTHARRHPGFYMELFHRMLHETECLVQQGLLAPDLPCPSFCSQCMCDQPSYVMLSSGNETVPGNSGK